MTSRRFLPVVFARLAATLFAAIAAWQADAASPWATGPKFQEQLSRPGDILWAENPLRQALGRLAEEKRTAIVLDRRVDPEQKLDVQISDVSLRAALQQIAASRGLGVSILGSVVYVGPAEAASRLRTLAAVRADDARRLPAAAARKFRRARPMRWDDLATPRSLLVGLAEDNGLELSGLDLVPHDLWAAADLPPLSLTDRLTLLAVQFDLTFAVQSDGAGLRLAPLPRRVALARSYPGGADPEATARRLAALAPRAEVAVVGGDVRVRGLVEDHERIEPPQPAIAQTKSPSPSAARDPLALKRFTLTVTEKPVGAILRQLAAQWKLELAVDESSLTDAGISLDRRISFHVREATADQLLRAIADAAGLSVSRRGGWIEVGAARR